MTRREWLERVAQATWEGLIPSSQRDAAATVLTPMYRDQIGRALVVAHVASDDLLAKSPRVIAASLVDKGLAHGDPLAMLVDPVVRSFRRDGAPWREYWDIIRLCTVLLEL